MTACVNCSVESMPTNSPRFRLGSALALMNWIEAKVRVGPLPKFSAVSLMEVKQRLANR